MKSLVLASAALILLSAAPALAMSCCGGGGKGKPAMCGKGTMAMQGATKRGKKACCCEGMAGNMSRRG